MELLQPGLPEQLECVVRWIADDGRAEDELHYHLQQHASDGADSCALPPFVPPMHQPPHQSFHTICDSLLNPAEEKSFNAICDSLLDSVEETLECVGQPKRKKASEIFQRNIFKAPEGSNRQTMRIISKSISTIVIVLMALGIAAFILPQVFGMELLAVVTPSMTPVHPVGSVVAVRPTPFDEIDIGDDITFIVSDNTLVTHRVVDIDPVTETFVTQGLTNNRPDDPVAYDNVRGVVLFSVPVVGRIFIWLEPTANKILVAAVIVAIWLVLLSVEKHLQSNKMAN